MAPFDPNAVNLRAMLQPRRPGRLPRRLGRPARLARRGLHAVGAGARPGDGRRRHLAPQRPHPGSLSSPDWPSRSPSWPSTSSATPCATPAAGGADGSSAAARATAPTQRSAAKSRRRALGVRRTSSRSRAHQPPGPSVRSEASSVRTPSRRWERRSSASSPAWTRTTRQALRRCITCQLARFRTVDQACARGAAPWGRRLARTTAFRLLARRRRGRLCRASSEARHSLGLAATPMPPSSTCRSTSACLQTSSNWSQTSSAATSSPLASSACAKPKSAQPLLG